MNRSNAVIANRPEVGRTTVGRRQGGFGDLVTRAMSARWGLLALFGIALVPRLIAAAWLGQRFYFIDETIYVDVARNLLAGLGFGMRYNKEPAFPVILALLGAPSSVVLLRMTLAAVAALGSLLIFELGRLTFGKGCGAAAALLWALDPLLVVTAGLVYPECLAALTLVATILLALRAARSDRLGLSVAAGLALGGLTLLRAVGFVLLPVLTLWAAFAPGLTRARRVVHVAVIVAAYVVALTPWTYRNYQVHGRFVPIARTGDAIAPRMTDEIQAKQREGAITPLLRVAYHRPLRLGRRVLRQFFYFWEPYPTRLETDYAPSRMRMHERHKRLPAEQTISPSFRDWVSILSFTPELALALIGLPLAWRRRRRETAFLAAMVLTYAFGYALFVAKLRYRITVLPEVFLFAGVAVSVLWQRVSSGLRSAGADR